MSDAHRRCVAALDALEGVADAAGACARAAAAFAETPRRALREDGFASFDDVQDWCYALGVIACVGLAALAAGLTMGIVGMEATELRVLLRTAGPAERKHARTLLPLVEKEPHHQVLVTLLLANSFANEALPLFLDALAPSWAAILFSVGFVLVFGEILPSAVFTGPRRLEVAAALAPAVHVAVKLLAPVAYPIATVLDRWVPEEARAKTGEEMVALVEVERELAAAAGRAAPFTEDEADLVRGAMALRATRVRDVWIEAAKVAAVPRDAVLDASTLATLRDLGHSRVPLRGADGRCVDFVLVKELVGAPADGAPLAAHPTAVRRPLWTTPDTCLLALLDEFQTGRSHVAFVCDDARARGVGLAGELRGIVTLEDIVEEIITEEIWDESDRSKAARAIQRWVVAKWPRGPGRAASVSAPPSRAASLRSATSVRGRALRRLGSSRTPETPARAPREGDPLVVGRELV